MTEWALKRGKVDWLVHAPLDVRAKLDVQKAKERAALGRRRVTHGHVVAELNLGFWRYLVSKRYYAALWVPNLRHAFPRTTAQAAEHRTRVESDLEQLLYLRNRAAHHETIHRRDLKADLDRAIALLSCIDPEAARWCRQREALSAVLALKPI